MQDDYVTNMPPPVLDDQWVIGGLHFNDTSQNWKNVQGFTKTRGIAKHSLVKICFADEEFRKKQVHLS